MRKKIFQIQKLKQKLQKCQRQLKFTKEKIIDYINIKEKALNFSTRISKPALFEWILQEVKSCVKSIVKTMSLENHLLIVLMKLRLGHENKDLALRLNISEGVISKIFRLWIKQLVNVLCNLFVWPERAAIRANLPNFKNCVCIIDCTEIFIERPHNLTARAQTYSTYKSRNTNKYLIGITSAGTISFLSSGWCGRAFDKLITIESGFLDKVCYEDCILTDRGFLVEEELATKRAVLIIQKVKIK
ncbi:uncharacterized protein LOC136085334 [Hydra vulgaris]|uniref:Uncharacterized protein LOC136085334 n=1 Tax=Hydra vulgaris TaxID=6087 RepID=A0ABM4CLN8_HYDVU